MCTLHLFFRVFSDAPVLFAANRDENLDRHWVAPARLGSAPPIYGPRDAASGGTWVGVNATGVLASLANHKGTLGNGASLCSRGAVVTEALGQPSARAAREVAERLSPVCKAYTLLIADPERAYVLDSGATGVTVHELPPGLHVVTNSRFGVSADPKARRSAEAMERLARSGSAPPSWALFELLSDHEPSAPGEYPLCVHPTISRFGTSSATVIALGAEGRVDRFLFAAGAPCEGRWSDLSREAELALRQTEGHTR